MRDAAVLFSELNEIPAPVPWVEGFDDDLFFKYKKSGRLRAKLPCVYIAYCKANGRRYVGSTADFYDRLKRHRTELNTNKHHSPTMQRAWNKYGGADAFDFLPLVVTDNERREEQWWLDSLDTCDPLKGFNISRDTTAPRKGRKQSPEAIAKMKKTRAESGKDYGAVAHGRKLSSAHLAAFREGGLRGCRNKRLSAETKERLRQIGLKKKGRRPAPHVLEASRQALLNPQPKVYADPHGATVVVHNLAKFCRENDLCYRSMRAVAKGKQPQHRGWTRYVEAISFPAPLAAAA